MSPRASSAPTGDMPPSSIRRSICPRSIPRFRRKTWFLVVSRLVPHKRVDLAVRACTRYGIPLKVVGTGRSENELRGMAGPTVEFLGRLDDDDVQELMARCKGFILAGSEDFGISAVEAQAAGRPVIAFGAGGALESVIPGETGALLPRAHRRIADGSDPRVRYGRLGSANALAPMPSASPRTAFNARSWKKCVPFCCKSRH